MAFRRVALTVTILLLLNNSCCQGATTASTTTEVPTTVTVSTDTTTVTDTTDTTTVTDTTDTTTVTDTTDTTTVTGTTDTTTVTGTTDTTTVTDTTDTTTVTGTTDTTTVTGTTDTTTVTDTTDTTTVTDTTDTTTVTDTTDTTTVTDTTDTTTVTGTTDTTTVTGTTDTTTVTGTTDTTTVTGTTDTTTVTGTTDTTTVTDPTNTTPVTGTTDTTNSNSTYGTTIDTSLDTTTTNNTTESNSTTIDTTTANTTSTDTVTDSTTVTATDTTSDTATTSAADTTTSTGDVTTITTAGGTTTSPDTATSIITETSISTSGVTTVTTTGDTTSTTPAVTTTTVTGDTTTTTPAVTTTTVTEDTTTTTPAVTTTTVTGDTTSTTPAVTTSTVTGDTTSTTPAVTTTTVTGDTTTTTPAVTTTTVTGDTTSTTPAVTTTTVTGDTTTTTPAVTTTTVTGDTTTTTPAVTSSVVTSTGVEVTSTSASSTTVSSSNSTSSVAANNTTLAADNTTLSSGNTTLTDGNTTVTAGNTTVTIGNTTVTASNTTVTAGNTTVTVGNTTVTADSTTTIATTTTASTTTPTTTTTRTSTTTTRTTTASSACPQTLTARQGSFSSPFYPGNYDNNRGCIYTIRASGSLDVIKLTFNTFELEGPSYCPWDWVKVYDGDGTTLMGTFCGATIPATLTSTRNVMRVEFSSDSSVTYQGFSASYTAYNPYSDELQRQYDLFPFGPSSGDSEFGRSDDEDILRIRVPEGLAVAYELETDIYVSNKGLVTFNQRDKGKNMVLKAEKKMLAVYNADISTDGAIYYKTYTDSNSAVLVKASNEIREFTEFKSFTANYVLLITWHNVTHRDSDDRMTERATFQLALVSNGRLTFGLVYYKLGAMRWQYVERKRKKLLIGFSNGLSAADKGYYYYPASHTQTAFTSIDTTRGNTGRYGMWLYTVGDSYSPNQECRAWYNRNLALKQQRSSAFARLPQCPCRWWWMWGNWRFSHWASDYSYVCYRLSWGTSWWNYPYGKECCYSTVWWTSNWWVTYGQYIATGANAGTATAYNPSFWELINDYYREDRNPQDLCCRQATSSQYCDLYHELRPVGQCTFAIPFIFSWLWGDPHIKTLDGRTYTCNSWGEYTLVQIRQSNLTFTLQGRTGLAQTDNGTQVNATVFIAFGMKENTSRVFVSLDPNDNQSLIIYGDESDYSTEFRRANASEIVVDAAGYMMKKSNDSKQLEITFVSDIGVTISVGTKSLDISVSMPKKYSGMTLGMMGNFDGNPDNDFVKPDGQNMTGLANDRDILQRYAPLWAVTNDTTVMRYPLREGPANYSHPEFIPIFLDEVDPVKLNASKLKCGETALACIYDYVATGSERLADSSKNTSNEAVALAIAASNTVPVLSYNGSSIQGNDGSSVTISLQGRDPDVNDSLTYYAVDTYNNKVTVNSSGQATVFIDINTPLHLRFYAQDSRNATSPILELPLTACSGCSSHGTCDFSDVTASNITNTTNVFLIARCRCWPAWTGDICQNNYNACLENPCDVRQNCTDFTPEAQNNNTVGFSCSDCFAGFQRNNTNPNKCEDVNECAISNGNCSHNCTNTAGSYYCTCPSGYRLSSDGRTCQDINECAERTDGCQQQCVNSMGNFSCQCYPGYTTNSKGQCEADASTNASCIVKQCSQGCQANGSDTRCICNSGYQLASNNQTCTDINECQQGLCSQQCTNTQGGFVCTCYPGNLLGSDQRTCTPCPEGSYGQDCRLTCECNGRHISCHSVTGCNCMPGWTGSQCESDINECAVNASVCKTGKLCQNTNGSYTCICPPGYFKTVNGDCQDLNECETGSVLNTCGPLEVCNNVQGSFYCSCRPGYTRTSGGNCTDINECASSLTNQCEQLCANEAGSFNCFCRFGYRLDSNRYACVKVADVCQAFQGLNCSHGCSLDDINNQAYCFCNDGYTLSTVDRQTCVDNNECNMGTHGCNGTCVNTEGGYRCTCPVGKLLDNDGKGCLTCPSGTWGINCSTPCGCGLGAARCDLVTGCVCNSGWSGTSCDLDINECNSVAEAQQTCINQNAQCQNTPGSYVCRCATGYAKNANNLCEDVDECANSPCEQRCENSPGSYRCLCNKGFSFDTASNKCLDINECTSAVLNRCSQTCQNLPGAYRCSCNSGFKLDNDAVTCIPEATCNRTDCPHEDGGCNGNDCFCNNGYNLTSNASLNFTCQWISVNSCIAAGCERNCASINDGRSFECSCPSGYLLNNDLLTCRECASGFYGNCSTACTCNMQNSQSCDKVTGNCSCKAGWTGSNCDQDVNECSNTTICSVSSTCFNTDGSYVCKCALGLFNNGTDCRVCAANSYGENCASRCTCSENAVSCNNVNGSCICQTGWTGATCSVDVNECQNGLSNCPNSSHVICINTPGSSDCGCEVGYSYNNGSCDDVNECLIPSTNNCTQVCNNTVGSFFCSCNSSSIGTGNDCTVLKTVTVTTTLNMTAPVEIDNPYSPVYQDYKVMVEKEIFDKMKDTVKGLHAILVKSMRRGSLIIIWEAILNTISNPTSSSSFTVALVSLTSLNINGTTASATVTIDGTTISPTTSRCDLFQLISGPCPAGYTCQVSGDTPSCQTIKEEDNSLVLIVCLSVILPVTAIVIVIAVLVFLYKKHVVSKTAPLTVEVDDGQSSGKYQPLLRPGSAGSGGVASSRR